MVAASDGKLYVFGGMNTAFVTEYDTVAKTWTKRLTLPTETYYSGCTTMPSNPNKIMVGMLNGPYEQPAYNALIFDITDFTYSLVYDGYNNMFCSLDAMGSRLCMNSCGSPEFGGCREYVGGSSPWSPITAGQYVYGNRYMSSTLTVNGLLIPNKPARCTGV